MATAKKQTPSPQNEELRKTLIAKVHVAQSKLTLSDEDYRAVLQSVSSKDSSKDMTIAELQKVLLRMESLGFKPSKPKTSLKGLDRQTGKIKKLWLELNQAGLVRDPNESALNAYIKRQTGIDNIAWLSSEQAQNVIEALKKWLGRKGSN